MTEIPKGDEYDTSAVDTHILEVAKRERSITQSFRIKNFGQMVLWGGLAGIIFALAFILISYGVRLMIYPPPEKEFLEQSIPSEITLKLDEPILVELNDETQDQKTMREIDRNIKNAPNNKVVGEFTKFIFIEVGGYEVVSGWRYENSNSRNPSTEYCYVTYSLEGNKSIRHNIGQRDGNEFTEIPDETTLVEEMNISSSLAIDIIDACQWFN